MTAAWDPAESARLLAELREDDARMTRWPSTHAENSANAVAIARLRNNARPIADQLEAAAIEIERLKADVVAADERMAGVLDGTFAIGDGTAQAEIERLRAELATEQASSKPLAAAHALLFAEVMRARPVVEASLLMREAEADSAVAIDADAAAIPSCADLYARAVVAGQRTQAELTRWRGAIDAYRAGKP